MQALRKQWKPGVRPCNYHRRHGSHPARCALIHTAGSGANMLLAVFGVAAALYFLPTIIGALRHVVNLGSVAAINLLLGWTLIGWAIAMAMALRTNPPHMNKTHGVRGSTCPGCGQFLSPGSRFCSHCGTPGQGQ